MYNLKKEECGMRRFKKAVLLVLLASMVVGGFQAWGWTQSETNPQQTNPEKDLYSLFDLFLVRPAAALAGVAGAGILPTNSVDKAADMFVVAPFRFAFKREFPDEGI
jgi:hypothetical protein